MLNDYRKMLRHEMAINQELLDLVKDCFDEIFGESSATAKNRFDFIVNNYEEFGCIQSLRSFKEEIVEDRERRAKWLADQALKDKK